MLGFLTRNREVPHPAPVSDRRRADPVHVRAMYPVGSNIDHTNYPRELAPQPPATSAFDIIGKRPPEVVRPVTSLAIGEWHGVAGWPFSANRPLAPLRVPIGPHQSMVPFGERVNVDMPSQTSQGAQTAIAPTPYVDPVTMAKLAARA